MKKIFSLIFISLNIINSNIAQTATNYGFEAWTTVSATYPAPAYDDPDNWNSLNSLTSAAGAITCYKATGTADVHSGSAAVKLVTKSVAGQIANGLITTGTIHQATSSVDGGTPYTLRPDSIIGWYKYAPVNNDQGFVEIQLLGTGGNYDTVGYAIFRTPNATVATYTRFAKKIIYRDSISPVAVAKSLWILSSSYNNSIHYANSTMFIDDIQLGSNSFLASGINELSSSDLTVGPNPSSGNLIINNINSVNAFFVLYDITGKIIEKQKISSSSTSIDFAYLSNGLYVYNIIDENNLIIKTGKIIIQK